MHILTRKGAQQVNMQSLLLFIGIQLHAAMRRHAGFNCEMICLMLPCHLQPRLLWNVSHGPWSLTAEPALNGVAHQNHFGQRDSGWDERVY